MFNNQNMEKKKKPKREDILLKRKRKGRPYYDPELKIGERYV